MNIGTMIIFFLGMKNINLVIICQYLFRFSNPAVYSRIYNRFPKEKKIDCKLYPCTNMCIFDNDIMCKTSSLYLCLFRSIHKSKDELQITFIWQYVYTYSIYVFMAMMLYFSISWYVNIARWNCILHMYLCVQLPQCTYLWLQSIHQKIS